MGPLAAAVGTSVPMGAVERIFAVELGGVLAVLDRRGLLRQTRPRPVVHAICPIRACIVVVAILMTRLGVFRGHGAAGEPWRAAVGLVLFGLGLGVRDLTARPSRSAT